MNIKKEECTFDILEHDRLNSALRLIKQIRVKFEVDNIPMQYYVTNAGIIPDNAMSYFCPKSFYQVEAQKYIDNIPDEFMV